MPIILILQFLATVENKLCYVKNTLLLWDSSIKCYDAFHLDSTL